MSCSINADNGVISGITGIRTTADNTGNLALQSNGVTVLTVNTANTVAVGSGGITFSDNTTITSHAAPNVTVYTSGSGTYTTPSGAKWLYIKMVGGGGGGSGGGQSSGTVAGAGNATTFGTSLLTANGGSPGLWASIGGTGGTAVNNASGLALTGGGGGGYITQSASNAVSGSAAGGNSAFGGGGASQNYAGAGVAGAANTGGGGGGGGGGNSFSPYTYAGTGGGAGGYVEAYISSPSSTYSYSVGAGGTAGGAGPAGYAGGAGGSGIIIVTAYF